MGRDSIGVRRHGHSDWESLDLQARVTLYALRHSSIVRQLLENVPIRIVAVNHDTSVTEIEKNYSHYIGYHGEAMTRRTLLDLTRPLPDNVVPLPSRTG